MSGDAPFSWGNFDPAFVDELAGLLRGKRVLEVFAGNGLLASLLADRGVDVVATSLFTGHDGSYDRKFFDVVEMEAGAAVNRYSDEADVLLMAWPTTTEAAARAAALWGDERDIVYVGETAVEGLPFGGYPGCASDMFFEITDETAELASYRGRNAMDRATVRRTDPRKADLAMASGPRFFR